MRQGRTLYRRVADIEPNNLPQSELESVQWLWRNLPLSKIPPGYYQRLPSQKTVTSWVFMRLGRTLYRCEAEIKPNNLPQSELESVQPLWRNLLSSKIPPGLALTPLPQKTAISWVLILHIRTLYRRVAGVEPNNLQKTESKSVKRLWSNQPSSI